MDEGEEGEFECEADVCLKEGVAVRMVETLDVPKPATLEIGMFAFFQYRRP